MPFDLFTRPYMTSHIFWSFSNLCQNFKHHCVYLGLRHTFFRHILVDEKMKSQFVEALNIQIYKENLVSKFC